MCICDKVLLAFPRSLDPPLTLTESNTCVLNSAHPRKLKVVTARYYRQPARRRSASLVMYLSLQSAALTYLQSLFLWLRNILWPFGQYQIILLGDRHICPSGLPSVIFSCAEGDNQTRDLRGESSAAWGLRSLWTHPSTRLKCSKIQTL